MIIPHAVLLQAHKVLSCPNSENILFLILNRNPNIFPCLTQESIGARLYWQPWDSSKISENHFYNMRLFPSLDREAGRASPGSAPRGCSFPWLVGMVCLQANQILWKKHLRIGNGHFLSAPLLFSFFFFFSWEIQAPGKHHSCTQCCHRIALPIAGGLPNIMFCMSSQRPNFTVKTVFFGTWYLYIVNGRKTIFYHFGLNMHKAP